MACGGDGSTSVSDTGIGGAATTAGSTGGAGPLVGTGGITATGGSSPGVGAGGAPQSVTGGANSLGGQSVIGSGGAGSGGQAATGGRVNATGGAAATGGSPSVGGSLATGGLTTGGTRATTGGSTATTGGTKATGGVSASAGTTAIATGGTASVGGGSSQPRFSFFVASQVALTRLSGSANGFGGDLRYGTADGLTGADKICTEIAESVMVGSSVKGWRAFLSVTAGPAGTPVNAIDRVGPGPWYDRLGRVVALTKAALANVRPQGADAAIINDLPNETGTPNHVASGTAVDNHDTLTGSNAQGQIGSTTRANTCNDWTSAVGSTGQPQIGHSWPRTATSAMNWIADHNAPGCAAGVNTGSQNGSGSCVGCSGGYGGFYCFALTP
jgi:hypothetical protein